MKNEKLDLSKKRIGEFLVKNIFDVKTTKGFDKGNVSFETSGIEFIGRTNSNNGLQGFVKPIMGTLPNQGNTISISQIGAQTAQYRKNPWYSSQNIFILLDKVKVLNKNVKLYFITVLNKNLSKYSGYSSFPSLNDIKNTTLTLPIKEDGTPDYEWMDQYISQIKKEKEKEINIYLEKNHLNNSILTEQEKLFLDKWRSGSVKMGEFLVGDLFFKKTIKGVPKSEEDLTKNENGYHIFGQNIKYQYEQKILLDSKYLNYVHPDKPIIAYTSSTGQINIIQESFYRTGNNGAFQGLFLKNEENTSLEVILYLLSVLKQKFKKYSYGTSISHINELYLTLPIKEDGTPDYEAMEQYILIMKKMAVKKLNQKYNDTISKTEEVANNH